MRLSTNLRSIASLCAITWTSAVDALITHLVAIALLLSGQYWLSSLTFSVDSAMRIAAAPILATRIAMTSEALRGRCSFILKCLTAVLGSAVILASAETSRADYSAIALFVLAKMTSVLDGLFGAHLIYKLEADRHIGLSTSSAALNIVGRGATAIAPALSLAILHSAALAEAIVLSVLLLQATAMWFSRDLFLGDAEARPTPPVPHPPGNSRHDTLITNPFSRWGLLFALLENFSLAGVTLLLMRYLQANEAPLLNEISALYFAFFASQVVVLIYGDRVIPASTIRGSSMWLHLAGALTLSVALTSGSLRLAMCVLLGAAYGVLLSSISKCVLPSIGRTLYVSYLAWAQPVARGASMAATLLIGLAMSHGIETHVLLMACGVSALAAATALFFVSPAQRVLSGA